MSNLSLMEGDDNVASVEWMAETARKAYHSFPYFIENVFPLSFNHWDGNEDGTWNNPPEGAWVPAPHIKRWAYELQTNNLTARLCARKHLKSTTFYAYVMWKLFRCQKFGFECLYLSYNETMASYHTGNIKQLIKRNIFFDDVYDLTHAETHLAYSWDVLGKIKFVVTPAGIGGFKRGRHPRMVIADDILADPKNPLNLTVINTITKVFFEDVMSLPQEGGECHLGGTPQDDNDVFFQIKKRGRVKTESSDGFFWSKEPAILNWKDKKVVWPNLFSFERLMEIQDEILEKSFNKEYQCSPIRSEDAFFKRAQLEKVSNETELYTQLNTQNTVLAGWDLGKKRHPSHFSVFEIVGNKAIQRYQVFWDGVDYSIQLGRVKRLKERLMIDIVGYDNTRGEFEVDSERGDLPYWMEPIHFSRKMNQAMAKCLEEKVGHNEISLINDQRQIDVMLQVDNDLHAVETDQGHGDSFWSNAIAMYLTDEPVDKNPSCFMELDD